MVEVSINSDMWYISCFPKYGFLLRFCEVTIAWHIKGMTL